MENLRLARSEHIDAGLAAVSVAMQVVYSVPFLILGGLLAFPFRQSVWRCNVCGHIPDQPGATLIPEQTGEQGTSGRQCIYCGKEILESAVACPHCWKEQKPLHRGATTGRGRQGFTIAFDVIVPLALIVGSFLYWQNSEPSSALGHHQLGWAQFQAGRVEQSIVSLTKAVELAPSSVHYKNRLSFALAEHGEFQMAPR